MDDQTSFLTAVQPETLDAVAEIDLQQGSLADLGTDQVLVHVDVATDHGWAVGDEIPAAFASVGDRPLTVAGIYGRNEMLGDYAISRDLYDELYQENLDDFVLVKLQDGADPAAAQDQIEEAVLGVPEHRGPRPDGVPRQAGAVPRSAPRPRHGAARCWRS